MKFFDQNLNPVDLGGAEEEIERLARAPGAGDPVEKHHKLLGFFRGEGGRFLSRSAERLSFFYARRGRFRRAVRWRTRAAKLFMRGL